MTVALSLTAGAGKGIGVPLGRPPSGEWDQGQNGRKPPNKPNCYRTDQDVVVSPLTASFRHRHALRGRRTEDSVPPDGGSPTAPLPLREQRSTAIRFTEQF
jgi:hypothetical protein